MLTVRLLPRRGTAARSAVAAIESTTVLVAGHTAAGGMLPSLPWIALMGAAVFVAGLPVLAGRVRLRWAVPVLMALQLVLHAWLTVLAPMPEMSGMSAGGASGAMTQTHGASLGALLAPEMLLVHAAGALVAALLWELRAHAVDVIVTWARPELPPLTGAPRAATRTPYLPWTVAALVMLTAPRRGPPVPAGLVPAHA